MGRACLVALYLRGLPREDGLYFGGGVFIKRWPKVVAFLRDVRGGFGRLPEAMRGMGLWEEAAVLEEPGRFDFAMELVEAGLVLTCLDEGYPRRWTRVLGSGAPPVLWCLGAEICLADKVCGIVGKRQASVLERENAFQLGKAVGQCGMVVCSGGATGIDQAGVFGRLTVGGAFEGRNAGARTVEILPFGLARCLKADRKERKGGLSRDETVKNLCVYGADLAREGRTVMSLATLEAPFSGALAMERNALIYAMGDQAVVVASHLKSGGTWGGAVDALRRKLTTVLVAMDGSASASALCGLGAVGIRLGGEAEVICARLKAAMLVERATAQPQLFGGREVRESRADFTLFG